MENYTMHSSKLRSKGFTLIATLLLLLLMSGIAIGMLMMVSTEGKVGTQDVQNNTTFHAAEGAIEKMTSDLANTFQNIESPTVSDITGLSSLAPTNTLAVGYPLYTLTPATNSLTGALATTYGQIANGPYAGLSAQLLPVTLQATAQGPLGDEVNMSRTVQVALIPVFQFGVFSDSDLGFFSSPNLDFAGRVHTNGDLYLGVANAYTLTFHTKLTAFGNVIRANLPNGLSATSFNDNGVVLIPFAAGGCDGAQPACLQMSDGSNRWGSVTGAGGNPPVSPYNSGPPSWQTISITNYNQYLLDGDYGNSKYGTGVSDLSLPFVNGTTGTNTGPQPFEIVRRPPPGESVTSPLGSSRLYNEAEIRVLLSDDPNELPCGNPSVPPPCGGSADTQNIRLANYKDPDNTVDYSHGVITGVPSTMPGLPGGHFYTTYFATGSSAVPDPSTWTNSTATTTLPADWWVGPIFPPPVITLHDPSGANQAPYMVRDANGNAVTKAPGWLNLDLCVPSTPVVSPPALSPPACDGPAGYPYYSVTPYSAPPLTLAYPTVPANNSTWNLLDGYLRVEYRDATGVYHPVTQEWLGLGFARANLPPTVPGTNPISPNAILLLQQPADRNNNGAPDSAGSPNGYTTACTKKVLGVCTQTTWTPYPAKPPEVTVDATTLSAWYGDSAQAAGNQSASQYNWYPINIYDPREGEPRDAVAGNNSCTPAGVMNMVEIDVGNLQQWLAGKTGVSGKSVDYVSQNGYVLYFSDRRGMLPNPNGTQVDAVNTKTGDSGLEDTVNSASAAGVPDGLLDPVPPGKTVSPEDTNLNSKLDNFGAQNLGIGLAYNPMPLQTAGTVFSPSKSISSEINAGANPNPYTNRIPACTQAQISWISGARHALRLVDGTLGNLPVRPDQAFPNSGGFTVGSENPVYIWGDYNSNSADPIWTGGADQPHSAAGIVADAVTVLSDNWSDLGSLLGNGPTDPTAGRTATTTYYRVAIAAGKNMNFPFPGWETNTDYGFGTDGGVHNFLRFLEDWSAATLNYNGSLVSLYYANYATGLFKCCAYSVYEPPTRNYSFDTDFQQPQNLPPGTPMFRDIDNLSYRQSFSACANVVNGVCTN